LRQKGKVDFAGAIAITAALILLVYAIVTANDKGWTSAPTIGLALGSVGLLAAFVAIEKRSKSPMIPLGIFKVPNLKSSNIVMALLGAAWIPMWFFLNLYLQQVHGYGPFESGLALLPMTAAIMILMVGASSRIISKIGVKTSMVAGLSLLAVAMVLFSTMPYSGSSFLVHVLPASLIAAGGMSLAYIPVLMSAVSYTKQEESGLASGIVNTSYTWPGNHSSSRVTPVIGWRQRSWFGQGIERVPACIHRSSNNCRVGVGRRITGSQKTQYVKSKGGTHASRLGTLSPPKLA
jgi:hypothetical protein